MLTKNYIIFFSFIHNSLLHFETVNYCRVQNSFETQLTSFRLGEIISKNEYQNIANLFLKHPKTGELLYASFEFDKLFSKRILYTSIGSVLCSKNIENDKEFSLITTSTIWTCKILTI